MRIHAKVLLIVPVGMLALFALEIGVDRYRDSVRIEKFLSDSPAVFAPGATDDLNGKVFLKEIKYGNPSGISMGSGTKATYFIVVNNAEKLRSFLLNRSKTYNADGYRIVISNPIKLPTESKLNFADPSEYLLLEVQLDRARRWYEFD